MKSKNKRKRTLHIDIILLLKFNTAMRTVAEYYYLTEKVDFNVVVTKNINGIISLDLDSMGYNTNKTYKTLRLNLNRECEFLHRINYKHLVPFHVFSRTLLHSTATNKPWITKKLFREMNDSYKRIKRGEK